VRECLEWSYGGYTSYNDVLQVRAEAPIPVTIAPNSQGITVNWIGGTPPFEIQQTSDLRSGNWDVLQTSASFSILSNAAFYRVMEHRAFLRFVFVSPENQMKNPCFMVALQCQEYGDWNDDLRCQQLPALLKQLQAEFNVDPDRLYITGLSNGVIGVWDALSQNQTLFAAGELRTRGHRIVYLEAVTCSGAVTPETTALDSSRSRCSRQKRDHDS